MDGAVKHTYPIETREVIADSSTLRVQILTLAAGQCVPWQYHSEITDTFICMEGPMRVETRAPRETFLLQAGESCAVGPKTAHRVSGVEDGPCKFTIVQGVGAYDFVPVGG